MTHILLLDGKIWAFEPPEKPESPTIGQSVEYERACFRAFEKKLEVDRSSFTDSCLISQDGQAKSMSFNVDGIRYYLDANEPIKWEGEVVIIPESSGPTHFKPKLARLIAPVKEENSAMSYTEGSDYTLSRESDEPGIQLNTKISTSPVPSEQEKQEEMWKEFFNLIDGPTSDRYIQAMKQFSITRN